MTYDITNDKWRCGGEEDGCGAIFQFESVAKLKPCTNCGTFNWHQIAVVRLCDFCGSEQAPWDIPCADFTIDHGGMLPNQSISGAWAACGDCKEDVLHNGRSELLNRALKVAFEKDPSLRMIEDILLEEMASLHNEFFAHRNGDPMLATEEVPT